MSVSARARRPNAPEAAAGPPPAADAKLVGRVGNQAVVKGHLKRQPCGPRGSERKLIWVERYEARRWVAPGPVRVVVGP